MTRHISLPVRTAGAVEAHVKWIAENWDTYRETCWALGPDVLRAGGNSDRRTPGHSDPTSVIALADTGYTDTEEALTATLAQVRWVIDRMQTMLVQHGPQAREADANRQRLRCDGSIDPLCTEYASVGRNGICEKCYWRDYRARKRAATSPATPDVVHSANLDKCDPVEQLLPSLQRYTAVMECLHCGETFTAEGPDDIQARGDVQILKDRHQCAAVPQPS